MKRLTLMSLFVLGLAPLSAWAAEPDSSHRQAARELLESIGTGKVMMTAASAMLDAQVKANPQMAPYRDVIQKWLEKNFTWEDRKSTRLNSSHTVISYAVF